MRIALLTNFFSPENSSGIARYVEDLASALAKRNRVDVISICVQPRPTEFRDGFNVHWIAIEKGNWLNYLPSFYFIMSAYFIYVKLIGLHKQEPFKIIEYPNYAITAIFLPLVKFPGFRPKFVLRLSSPRSISPKVNRLKLPRLSEFLEIIQARIPDGIISNTIANLELCEKAYGFSKKLPRAIISHGLPLGTAPRSRPLEATEPNIFFLGRMESRKGFDILAAAWPLVLESVPEATLSVAGDDLACREGPSFFEWAIRDLPFGARKRLNYLGRVTPEHRERLYKDCAVFVMPSRYESFGLVLLEAMRYGKPVVSCFTGGIPEVVSNNNTGLLVPPEDPHALACALVTLLQSPELRWKFGENALIDLQKRFTLERVALQTEEFYRHLTIDHEGMI